MIFIICATGSSVNGLDWEKLTQYKTIGFNQFFRKGIPTDYYYIYDKMCILRENPNFTTVLNEWPDTTFFIDKRVPLPDKFRKNTNIVRTTSSSVTKEEIARFDKHWAKTIDDELYINKSSVTAAINLAHIFGASDIYIAGLDGYGGYFYPHKKNRYETRLHDSLIHYPKYGTLAKSLKHIIEHLKDNHINVYSLNPKSFFVQKNIMKFKVPWEE